MKNRDPFSAAPLGRYRLSVLAKSAGQPKGFTLLELIVVFLILGTLAAVSIPVFFGQIGKARESEVLLKLGSIARTQQSYHFLNGKFALTMAELEANSGPISTKYHDLDNITGDPLNVKVQAIALNPGKDQVRDYAIGVYFDNGAFYRATCQGALIGSPVQVGNLAIDPCSNGGTKLQ